MFIQELYNTAEQAPEFAQGKSPVVQITGSKPIKVGKGNTRVPQFTILKWIDRPGVFDGHDEPASAPAPAPKAAPAPAAAAAADEF